MIRKILIKKTATFGTFPEEMADLAAVNFVYGSNGTGKTTISRLVANEMDYPDCQISWHGTTPLKTLVYNRDFVEKNFNQPDELKGIFTLGEKDKATLEQIETAYNDLTSINDDLTNLKTTLEGDESSGGKVGELQELEEELTEKCWVLKQKYDETFQEAFKGYRGRKQDFKVKLINESTTNSAAAVPLAELKRKAETVFGDTPQQEEILVIPNWKNLLNQETDPILKKKVIGKSDVDIAAMILKLGNSDWVKEGRKFYDPEERICPFCQQDTGVSLEKSLNDYFDETFETDSAAISKLHGDYKSDSLSLLQNLQTVLTSPSKFLNQEKLQAEYDLLESKTNSNTKRIEEKQREPSRQMDLNSLKNNLDAIKTHLDTANTAIREHNLMVRNLRVEKTDLTQQVWRYLLDHEINHDLASYNSRKNSLKNAIASLNEKIGIKNKDKYTKEQEVKRLEKETISIQPTIHDINGFLTSFGFQGFVLAKSERERFYKIQRPDGSDAKETLSEGERNFIAFLYFYHLLKGSESESGITSDRVVVFDDPVSSLDSDILFIVSSLIKKIFDDVRNETGTVKQVFVLTHNVYFHKEVSFNSRRQAEQKLRDETFWVVRKSNQISKIVEYDTNPIKTSYELLWAEVRNQNRDNLAIQNTLRRILENYFKILGGVDPDKICDFFDGKEKQICKSLFSWVNDGSHSAHDSLYISIDESVVESYLDVFKQIFEKTNQIAHYEMMMGKE